MRRDGSPSTLRNCRSYWEAREAAQMPTPKQQRRQALELLEASIDGCTEAIMLAYGFKTELLVELVNAGLATATIDRMVVGRRRVKVVRMRITAAGRRALAKLRWP